MKGRSVIMPKVSMFVYAEGSQMNVNQQGQQQMLIVNPQIVFTPMFVPSQFSFSMHIGFTEIDLDKEHIVRLVFWGPDDEVTSLVDTMSDVRIPIQTDNPKNLPADMRGLIMNMDFKNVIFSVNGTYSTDVYLDGEKLGSFPIKAKGQNV